VTLKVCARAAWNSSGGCLPRPKAAPEFVLVISKSRLLAVLADGGLQVVDIERADFESSAALCEPHASGLRTPDALHAAVALRLRLMLIMTDRGQAAGCRFHAIACELVGA
jgi:predicted nucleic acid-binding protein